MSMSEASGSRQPQPSASDADAEQLFEEVQSRLTQLRMDPLPDKEVATQDTARLRSYNGFLAFLLSAQDGNTKVPSQSLSVAEQLRGECSRSASRSCGRLSTDFHTFCAAAEMKRFVQQLSCCLLHIRSWLPPSEQTATQKNKFFGTQLG